MYNYQPKNYPSGRLSGMVKPKYLIIKGLLGDEYDTSHGVDIFIDLNTFIGSMLSSRNYLGALPFNENAIGDIVSSFVQIALHWKNFSRQWNDVKIYLIMNDYETTECCEHQQLKSYLHPYRDKINGGRYDSFRYYLTEAINLTQKVFRFIPNLYLIKCKDFDSLVFPSVIKGYDLNNRKRIIVTGNNLFTGYMFESNCRVIFSKCRHTGISQVYDPIMITKSISQIDDDVMDVFVKNKVFYNLLNCIVGDFDRGILGMNGIRTTRIATEIIRGYEKGDIPQNPKSCESLLSVVDEMYHSYIRQVYPLIDLKTHGDMVKQSSIETIKSEQMIDNIDIDGLREFSIDGINLLELL
jgi:hypothetical protein